MKTITVAEQLAYQLPDFAPFFLAPFAVVGTLILMRLCDRFL